MFLPTFALSSAATSFHRSLTRHRLFAILNIGGLALGIAAFLVLILFVRLETQYDRRVPGSEHLWMVTSDVTMPDFEPFQAQTVQQARYERYIRQDAQRARLFGIGAVLAVVIACIGLYGLASFDTARRFREIGIRKTLGASTGHGLTLLIGRFLRPVVLATRLAWPIAYLAMRQWLSAFADRVALSPAFVILSGLTAVAIATATVFAQAWRVARAEPARALR